MFLPHDRRSEYQGILPTLCRPTALSWVRDSRKNVLPVSKTSSMTKGKHVSLIRQQYGANNDIKNEHWTKFQSWICNIFILPSTDVIEYENLSFYMDYTPVMSGIFRVRHWICRRGKTQGKTLPAAHWTEKLPERTFQSVDIFDAYENRCQVGMKHTLFAYRFFFFATLELFYLAALENLHAGLNGVENGVEVGEKGELSTNVLMLLPSPSLFWAGVCCKPTHNATPDFS